MAIVRKVRPHRSPQETSQVTIHQLDERTKARLRVRAAHHGRTMEEEARESPTFHLGRQSTDAGNLAEGIRRRFADWVEST